MAKKLRYKITDTPDGGYRVYLGRNQYVQRATKLAIQKVIREHKMTLANRGRKLAAVPSDLVAGLMALHYRCEAAGTTVWLMPLISGCRITPRKSPRFRYRTQSINSSIIADPKARLPRR